jgi:hypothetical protein
MNKLLSMTILAIAFLSFGVRISSAATVPLIWDAVTDATVTELRVYELAPTGRILLATLPKTATSYNVVKPPGEYSFTVVGYNGFWESPTFDIVTTPPVPPKVNGLKFGVILAAIGGGLLFAATFGVNGVRWLFKKIF